MNKREVIAEILECADVLDVLDKHVLATDLMKIAMRLAQFDDGGVDYESMLHELEQDLADQDEGEEDVVDPGGFGLNPDVFGPDPAPDNHLEQDYELQTELPE
jgi:hypothetical protein